MLTRKVIITSNFCHSQKDFSTDRQDVIFARATLSTWVEEPQGPHCLQGFCVFCRYVAFKSSL